MSDTSGYTSLHIEQSEDGVAIVTLAKPEIHNAFNENLIAELSECFLSLGSDENVRIIILTGEGKSFCAGADINWMKSMVGFSKEENMEDSQKLADMFQIINGCPKPVVGKINGAAFGGGVGLVAVCDIAIASESAKFSFSEVKLGIIPSVISPYVLAKIGPGNCRKLFVTGERFGTEVALRIGLVHDSLPEDKLDEAVSEIIKMLLANGPAAMGEVKLLVRNWTDLKSEEYRKYTVEKIAELRISPEGKEGLEAFLEKRKPNWRS